MIPHVGPIRDVFGLAPIFTQDWLDMAQHDAFLYAASASIQSDLNLLRCQSSRGFNVSTKVLRYQTKALVAVRQDIESGNGQVRDETILAVLYLSLVNVGVVAVALKVLAYIDRDKYPSHPRIKSTDQLSGSLYQVVVASKLCRHSHKRCSEGTPPVPFHRAHCETRHDTAFYRDRRC